MKVVFVNPPIKLPKVFAHYPLFSSLGVLSAAAVVRERGHDVSVVDAFFLKPRLDYVPVEDGLFRVGARVEEVERALAGRPADVVIVALTMFSDVHKLRETFVRETVAAARRAHKRARVTAADCYVCGMNYFPYEPERLLREAPGLDEVVTGEAEEGILAALGEKPAPRELDALPFPAYDLLDRGCYFGALSDAAALDLIHEYHRPERFIALLTSRGCPYSCSFCTHQVLKLPWRAHSPRYVARMVRHFKETMGVERFFFLDNNMNVDARRFGEIAGFMADLRLPWDALNGVRADRLTREHVRLLKAAGNAKLTVSAESADPEVLQKIVGKRLELKSVVDVARACQEEGLPSQVHYIIGLPGETKKQMNRTLEFAQMLYERHEAWPLLQHAIPFRGTALYEECESRGLFAEDPEAIGGWAPEERPIIRTEAFSPGDVSRMKAHFRGILDRMGSLCALDLGLACSNGCAHCETAVASPADREALRRRLIERRERGARELLITGGEPALEVDLALELAELGRALGYRARVLATNARAFAYEKLAREAVARGVDQAVVPIHSREAAVHDAIARAPGALVQAGAGVRNLLEAGLERLDVSIRLTPATLPGLSETAAFAFGLGASSLHLRFALPVGPAASRPEVLAPFDEAVPRVVEVLESFKERDVTVAGAPFCLFPDELRSRLVSLPSFELERSRPLKAKPEECLGCVDYAACLGFFRQEHEPRYRQSAARRYPR